MIRTRFARSIETNGGATPRKPNNGIATAAIRLPKAHQPSEETSRFCSHANSNSALGNDNWGLGPTFVVLHLDHGSPWVYGVLINNLWSVGTRNGAPSYNNGLIQPFVNYNFAEGLYVTTSPIITVNWKEDRSTQQWTVPIGGGVGKILHFGRLPVNMQVSGYYNVARPDYVANWQIRAQVQLMFPK